MLKNFKQSELNRDGKDSFLTLLCLKIRKFLVSKNHERNGVASRFSSTGPPTPTSAVQIPPRGGWWYMQIMTTWFSLKTERLEIKKKKKSLFISFSAEYGGVTAINVNERSRALKETHPFLWRWDESLLYTWPNGEKGICSDETYGFILMG